MHKKILTLSVILLVMISALGEGVNRVRCTYTKNGEIFNLYGKVQLVNSFPDIKVKIVDGFHDIKIELVRSFPNDCGKVQLVNSFPDVKVQLVNYFEDVKVKLVDSFPGF